MRLHQEPASTARAAILRTFFSKACSSVAMRAGGPYDDAAVRLRAVLAVHSSAVVFHPPLPVDRSAAADAALKPSTGALPGALAALFDESPANQGDPECPLEHRGFVLCLAASPTTLQAQHVWQSSLVLGDLVLDGDALVGTVAGMRVCELGAGAAYPSLACARMGAARVVATDYPSPALVRNMEVNIARNHCARAAVALPHRWGDSIQPLEEAARVALGERVNGDAFDIVMAADTLWRAEGHRDMMTSLCNLARDAETRVVLAFMDHDVDGATARAFMALTAQAGFAVLAHRDVDWSRGRREDYYGDVHVRVLRRERLVA